MVKNRISKGGSGMKAKLILINWCLSLCGLCIDTERSPLGAVLIVVVWFCLSTILLKHADKKGWLKEIIKHYKLDEL
jgi:hypothetical protein